MLDEPLAKRLIGERGTPSVAELEHRKHRPRKGDPFGKSQRPESRASDGEIQRSGAGVDSPKAMLAPARVEKMNRLFPLNEMRHPDAFIKIDQVRAAAEENMLAV